MLTPHTPENIENLAEFRTFKEGIIKLCSFERSPEKIGKSKQLIDSFLIQ